MVRTVNVEARAVRREAFVDSAQRLIQAKGYEQMSVQDVLDELGASRGAFYHYFDSKAALLEAVLERMADAVMVTLAPLLADPAVPAVQKLERLFAGVATWKNERKDLVLAITRVWSSDDNAIVREKFRKTLVVQMVPLLAAIIRQGRAEGVFAVTSADDVARVLWSLIQGAQDLALELFLARQVDAIPFETVEPALAAYPRAFERILGIPGGSLRIADDATLRLWFGYADQRKRSIR
jgi:AcrR family transcriptional regulator